MDWSKLFNDDGKSNISDVMKIAEGLTKNLSKDEKKMINNLDFNKIVEDVSKSVFKTLDIQQTQSNDEEKEPSQTQTKKRTNNLEFDLDVSLSELYSGKHKKIIVKRKRSSLQKDGSYKIIEEKKKIDINIEKGTRDEEIFLFQGEADQLPDYETGDIVVTLKETPHPEFSRHGDDLFVMKNIGISEVYYTDFIIHHLDGRTLRIKNDPDDVLCCSNTLLRKIPNEGMPVLDGEEVNQHGDLFIKFNIIFPKDLPDKEKLVQVFKTLNVVEENTKIDHEYVLEHVTDEDFDKMELINNGGLEYSYYEDDDEETESEDEDDDDEEESEEECV